MTKEQKRLVSRDPSGVAGKTCPCCKNGNMRAVDTAERADGRGVVQRHRCPLCGYSEMWHCHPSRHARISQWADGHRVPRFGFLVERNDNGGKELAEKAGVAKKK